MSLNSDNCGRMPLFAKHIDDLRVQRQPADITRESLAVDRYGELARQVLEIIDFCHVI